MRSTPAQVQRVVFCSGKVYFDLLKARRSRDAARRRAGAHRAALSVPGRGVPGGARALRQRRAICLVSGGAAESGRLVPDPPPPAGSGRRASGLLCGPCRRGRAGHRPGASCTSVEQRRLVETALQRDLDRTDRCAAPPRLTLTRAAPAAMHPCERCASRPSVPRAIRKSS